MSSSKEEFVEVIKKIRTMIASDECKECSCPNIRCELHGDCYNCIRAYRYFGHHVPRCLQFVLDKKMAAVSEILEKEMGNKPKTSDEFYDYLNAVMPKTDILHGIPVDVSQQTTISQGLTKATTQDILDAVNESRARTSKTDV